MKINLDSLGGNTGLVLAAALALGVVYFVSKKTLTAAGGLVSGNNAITAGTPYAGAGVVGTLGAATNAASGGVLSNVGGALGDWLYNTFNPSSSTAQAAQGTSRQQVVTSNYVSDLGALNSPNFGLLDPSSTWDQTGSTAGVNGNMGGNNFGTSGSGW